jgi:hypothetical protein
LRVVCSWSLIMMSVTFIIIIIAVIVVIIPEPRASHRRLTVYIFAFYVKVIICSCLHLCSFFPLELLWFHSFSLAGGPDRATFVCSRPV